MLPGLSHWHALGGPGAGPSLVLLALSAPVTWQGLLGLAWLWGMKLNTQTRTSGTGGWHMAPGTAKGTEGDGQVLGKRTAPGLAGRSGQPPRAATWNPPEGDRSAVRLRQTLHFSSLRSHTCHMVTCQRRCTQARELGESADRGWGAWSFKKSVPTDSMNSPNGRAS